MWVELAGITPGTCVRELAWSVGKGQGLQVLIILRSPSAHSRSELLLGHFPRRLDVKAVVFLREAVDRADVRPLLPGRSGAPRLPAELEPPGPGAGGGREEKAGRR